VRRAQRFTPLSLAAALVALLTVAGCTSTRSGAPVPERSEAFVRVENRSMLEMTIYVVRGG
jgi:hypothetical protein